MAESKPTTIDEYIITFSQETQKALQEVRNVIKQIVPEADETISYAIPTFKVNNKVLVHFAAFTNHIGLYAMPTAHEAFKKDFAKYKTGKGSVQFPLNEPLPVELIKKVIKYRIKEIT